MGRKRIGTAFPSSGGFVVQITTKEGDRPKRTLPATINGKEVTKATAKKVARECQTLYDKGFPVPLFGLNQAAPKEAPTVLAYAKECHQTQENLSRRDVAVIIKHHIAPAKVGQLRMGQVTKADVREWVTWLSQQKPQNNTSAKLSPKYLARIYQVLSYLFQLGAEFHDWYNPCAELHTRHLLPAPVARNHNQSKTYSTQEVAALLTDPTIKAERRMMYALYFFTGGRANELPAARFRDYQPEMKPLGRLTIARAFSEGKESTTKTRATRLVPVHPVLAALLVEWQSSGFEVFTGRKPTPEDFIVPKADGSPQKYGTIYTAFKRDCARLGISAKRLHDTRSTFISAAMDDGADKDALKRVTHTAPKTDAFDLYDQAAWRRVCRAVESLKIELPTREQKTMNNALDSAPMGAGAAQSGASKENPAAMMAIEYTQDICKSESKPGISVREVPTHKS